MTELPGRHRLNEPEELNIDKQAVIPIVATRFGIIEVTGHGDEASSFRYAKNLKNVAGHHEQIAGPHDLLSR